MANSTKASAKKPKKQSRKETDTRKDILIVGGDQDPNMTRMLARCGEYGLTFETALHGIGGTPDVIYDLKKDILYVNGREINVRSCIIRPDVFTWQSNDKKAEHNTNANDWFNLFMGWLMGRKDVKILNRNYFARSKLNKLTTLALARDIGIPVPDTFFTNSLGLINPLGETGNWIRKPFDGGEHTQKLEPVRQTRYLSRCLPRPITIQPQLIYPEFRLYRVGREYMGFTIHSQLLDYREASDNTVVESEVPAGMIEKYEKLTDALGFDFGAADFKTCPKSKELLLLEVNGGPMFSGFDLASGGKLTRMMLGYLTGRKL